MDIGSLAWFIAVVIGTLVLGAGIAFAMLTWQNRRQDPEIRQEQQDAVDEIYDDARHDRL